MSEGARLGDITLIRRLAAELAPHWPQIVAILALSLVAAPLALLAPLPLKIAVDCVLGGAPLPAWLTVFAPEAARSASAGLVLAGILVVAVGLLTYGLALAAWVLQAYAGERLTLAFRTKLFDRVQHLSLEHHERKGTADAIYRIQYDAPALQFFAINGLIPIAAGAATLVAMLYVTARIDRALALIALAIVPVLYVLTSACRKRLRDRWAEFKTRESGALSLIHEVLGALRIVKSFGGEERERDRFVAASRQLVAVQVRLAATEGGFDLFVGLTLALGTAAVLIVGVRHVQSGTLSLGDLLLVMGYLAQLYRPLETISRKTAELQSSLVSLERACTLLDAPFEVAEAPDARPLHRARGEITLERVSFQYGEGSGILDEISFAVPAGARVGIIGTTGGGKTTLISLLTRFYDPKAGRILLDGIDLRDLRIADLRRQFALVSQEPVLFSTTIAENIAYARPKASRAEIETAARAANAHDFIMRLPDGYATQVGERGMRLSGGERQRVSLARAFLKDAPILILDEPTSAVDAATEAGIVDSLELLVRGCTSFTITHRPTTLRTCDFVLELERGRVVRFDAPGRPPERIAARAW